MATQTLRTPRHQEDGEGGATELHQKIDNILQEMRVVLPGTQALLGFQLVAIFSDSYGKLPDSFKAVHLGSLLLVCLSIMLLMTPAAYHRIVNQGRDSESFHQFATFMLLAAMAALALGLCSDLIVVVYRSYANLALSVGIGVCALVAFLLAWFGFTIARRDHQAPTSLVKARH